MINKKRDVLKENRILDFGILKFLHVEQCERKTIKKYERKC